MDAEDQGSAGDKGDTAAIEAPQAEEAPTVESTHEENTDLSYALEGEDLVVGGKSAFAGFSIENALDSEKVEFLTTQLADKEASILEMSRIIEIMKQQMMLKESDFKAVSDKLMSLQETLSSEVTTRDQRITHITAELTERNEIIAADEQLKKNLEGRLTQLEIECRDVDIIRSDLAEKESAIIQVDRELHLARETIEKLECDLLESNRVSGLLELDLNENAAIVNGYSSEIDSLKETLATKDKQIESHQESIDSLNRQLTEAYDTAKRGHSEKEPENPAQGIILEQKCAGYEATITRLEEELASALVSANSFNDDERRKSEEALNQQLAECRNELEATLRTVDNLKEDISRKESAAENCVVVIESLKRRLSQTEITIVDNEQVINDLKQQLQDCKTLLPTSGSVDTVVDDLRKELLAKEATIAHNAELVEMATQQLAEKDASIATHAQAMDALKQQLGHREAAITAMKEKTKCSRRTWGLRCNCLLLLVVRTCSIRREAQ
jgi:chromosome segregation ATPase